VTAFGRAGRSTNKFGSRRDADVGGSRGLDPRLASAIAAALREIGSGWLRGKPVAALDVGCFPWHGSIELSVLTAEELDSDPGLLEPGEAAAWHHYNFPVGLASWNAAVELGRPMGEAYRMACEGGRAATADAFLRACARAVASPDVAAALSSLECDPRFRVSVVHPDNGRLFWPPWGVAEAERGAAPDRPGD
jgi:hypothetical protein